MPESYVGPTVVNAVLAPARALYLIAEDNKVGLIRAVQEASSRWGGVTEPIVPVSTSPESESLVSDWYRQVAEVSQVDGAVNINLPDDLAERAAARLGLPLTPLASIDHRGPTKWTAHPACIPSSASTEAYIISTPDRNLWEIVGAGDLTDDGLASIGDLPFKVRRPVTADEVARAQLAKTTLLERTRASLDWHFAANGPFATPAIAWVVDDTIIGDHIHFWNLRALQSLDFKNPPMFIIPATGVDNWINFKAQLAGRLARPDEFSPDLILASSHVAEEILDNIALTLGLEKSADEIRSGHRFPADPRPSPYTYLTLNDVHARRVDIRQWFVFDRACGLQKKSRSTTFRTGLRSDSRPRSVSMAQVTHSCD
ncbi:hypothetical protein I6A60_27945 [Frankia sp. AgB1.9]|uniref:hypothetical protein n=1 Tax=unclassified Frankia TaxID=2632575 RepID=UPI00193291C8|nr:MULTISPECIES: hypothetical protein [unclassified Frankia]MBL7488198.1 hypothetical protein [Frankia sp. AgW1.1]MBL7551664.1 hypothetical protein [Frankia sp. AgB1.9]MBL7620200.1 hypothetical protein [Frankia sp. AgB1.8]